MFKEETKKRKIAQSQMTYRVIGDLFIQKFDNLVVLREVQEHFCFFLNQIFWVNKFVARSHVEIVATERKKERGSGDDCEEGSDNIGFDLYQ